MEKPKNPEQYIGRKVRMINEDKHKDNPNWYPKVGTVGTIVNLSWTNNSAYVNWGENSGVGKGLDRSYTWYIDWKSIELVDDTDSHMTDEEIWEMFKPKMEKLGINYDGTYIRYPSILDKPKKYMDMPTVQKLVATVYRSGYGRGQKGRPFMIGEKKKQGSHWEWIKPGEIVPDGTKVRYMKRAEDDDGHDSYYPKIGQECIKLNSPGWPDSDFWVQFEGSEHEYTCLDSHRDCFQKWVEDDE